MFQKIVDIIISNAQELNEQLENKIPIELGPEAPLFGRKGVLDSMGLVTLVVAVEQALEDETGQELMIADEKALSQERSPFRTIGSLAEYVENLLRGHI